MLVSGNFVTSVLEDLELVLQALPMLLHKKLSCRGKTARCYVS